MKITLLSRRVCACFLALVTLLSTFSGMLVGSVSAEEASDAPTSALNFSDPSSALTATVLSPGQLLIYAEGEDGVTEEEVLYLDTLTDWQLLYHAQIPQTTVTTARDGEELTISASAYSYVAANGATVCFIPVYLLCEGETVPLTQEGEAYTATLTVAEWTTPRITVEFEAEVTIPRALMESLGDLAYTHATEAAEEAAVYEAALNAYVEATNAYAAYREAMNSYEIANVAYQAYLTALAKYETAVKEREAYEAEYATYEAGLLAYETYQAELKAYEEAEKALAAQVEANKAQYAQYEAYLAYEASVAKCREVLDVFEMVFVYSATGKQMYATLMGPTVTSVIDRREELIDYGGVSPQDIDNAGDATDVLRALLTEYVAIEEDSAKYAWYVNNYTTLRDTFMLLCTSLRSLFENYVVKAGLKKEDRYERYCEFVAHLYMISTCLDDSITPDSSWKIDRYKLYKILEAEYVMEDRNIADPSNTPWPKAVPKVEKPEITVVLPPYPTAVVKPIAPSFVPEAGDPPARVEEPVKPAECPPPGDIPKAPHISGELSALIPLLASGQLTARDPGLTEDLTVILSARVTQRPVYEQDGTPVLYFFDSFGQLIEQLPLAEGVLEEVEPPARPADERYTYTFVGWGDRDGLPVDLTSITENTELHPLYEKQARVYTVVFSTYEGDVTYELAYGETPVFTGSTERPSENGVSYMFVGWDKTIRPVTGNVVYTAQYSTMDEAFIVTWKIGDTELTEFYAQGKMPVCPVSPEQMLPQSGVYFYEFVGWDAELSEIVADVVYTAVLRETLLLPVNDLQNGIPVIEKAAAYTAVVSPDVEILSLATLISLAARGGKGIELSFEEGYALELDGETVQRLLAEQADELTVFCTREDAFEFSYTLKSKEGKALKADGMRIKITTPLSESESMLIYASADGVNFEETTFFGHGDQTVILVEKGYISYKVMTESCFIITVLPTEGGVVTLDRYTAAEGTKVTISILPNVGLEAVSVLVKGESRVVEVTADENGVFAFDMLGEHVEIEVVFAPARYTVEFYVDGELYHSAEFAFGDELVLPANPSKPNEGDLVYTFAGWSPDVVKTVTADAVYEAVFKQSNLAAGEHLPQSPYTQKLPVKLIVIASVTLVLGAGAITAVTVLRKKRKAALQANSTDKSTDA